jgi:glycosyltransferase involved in cell wall biosynthesis
MSNYSKVSVIITHFNRCEKLFKCVSSVLKQGHRLGEVIIVDDMSVYSEYEKIVSKYQLIDDVKIIRLEENSGPQIARNTGIVNAKYPLIAMLDCDDEWMPNKLDQLVRFKEGHNYDFVAHGFEACDENKNRIDIYEPKYKGDPIAFILNDFGHIQTSTFLIESSLAKKILFDEKVKKFQDWDFVIRAISQGIKFGYLDEKLSCYYMGSPDQMSGSANPEYATEYIMSVSSIISKEIFIRYHTRMLPIIYYRKMGVIKAIKKIMDAMFKYKVFDLGVFRPLIGMAFLKFSRKLRTQKG